MGTIVVDTETTGFDAPDVIELAYVTVPDEALTVARPVPEGVVEVFRYRPSKPIALGALATHHILETDLENEPPWPGQWMPPAGTEYIIGHNVDFDWQAIGSPHVARICTLALAEMLWPDLDSHSLGALTYAFHDAHEARELLRNAHDAGRDVELCCRVLTQILRARSEVRSWHELWRLSEQARVPTRFWFGKYGPANGLPGRLISEIRQEDPSYIGWCLAKCDQVTGDPYAQKAMRGEA